MKNAWLNQGGYDMSFDGQNPEVYRDMKKSRYGYICPECGRCVVDYEIWWEEDRIWKGKKVKFKCLLCGEKLVVEWNGEEFKVVKQS